MHCDPKPRRDSDIPFLVSRTYSLIDDLNLTNVEVASILRLPPGSWPLSKARVQCWQPDTWQETRLRQFVELGDILRGLLPLEAAQWLRSTNPGMFHRTPIALLMDEPIGLQAILFRLRNEASE